MESKDAWVPDSSRENAKKRKTMRGRTNKIMRGRTNKIFVDKRLDSKLLRSSILKSEPLCSKKDLNESLSSIDFHPVTGENEDKVGGDHGCKRCGYRVYDAEKLMAAGRVG